MGVKVDKFSGYIPSFEQEYCGLVLKNGDVVQIENSHASPKNNFQILEKDIAPYKDMIEAIWHTHIHSDPNLSIADYNCFLSLPDYKHIIITQTEIATYNVESGFVINVSRTFRNASNT